MASNDWEEIPVKSADNDWEEVTRAPAAGSEPDNSSLLQRIVGGVNAARMGLVKGATLGNVDPNKLMDKGLNAVTGGNTGDATPFQQNATEHPVASTAGQVAGSMLPGVGMGKVIGAVAPAGAGLLARAGRIGLNAAGGAAQGFAAKPGGEDSLSARASQMTLPALIGGGASAAMEGMGALKGVPAKFAGLKTQKQLNTYVENPEEVGSMSDMLSDSSQSPAFQDKAIDAIQNSRKGLRQSGLDSASKLRELLTGKQVSVNPNDFSDLPDAMEILEKYKNPYGQFPAGNVNVDANEANQLKRSLQAASQFKQGTVYDPVQTAKMGDYATKANQYRQSIESVDQGVKPLNDSMQQNVKLGQNLRAGLKNPISFVSTEAPDRVANLARTEQAGGQGLLDLGEKMSAAKALAGRGSPSANITNALGEGVKDYLALPALRGMHGAQKNATPVAQTLADILAQIQAKQAK